jgi:hypothetical protein
MMSYYYCWITTLGRPDIFNTDQGVQFTAMEVTGCLEAAALYARPWSADRTGTRQLFWV